MTFVYPIDPLPYANLFGASFGGAFYNLQLLATRSYAVLFAGGTVQPADHEPMRAVADSMLPSIDRAIELGIADPERYSHGLALDEASFLMPEHPWKDRERYIRNSPWFFLDKVETPLLLLHGTEDTGTIVTQANEIYLGLRRLGKEVEYARYDDEGHGFSALVNAVDAAERYIAWFNRYLQPEKAP